MNKSQHRNIRNVKKHGNTIPPKVHNSVPTDSKDIEEDEMPDKE